MITRVARLALILLVTEACAWLALHGLARAASLTYQPQRPTLSDAHRQTLQRLLNDQVTYHALSPLLGWTVKPHGFGEGDRANSRAIRSDREYEPVPPPGILRLAAFGDSFTKGGEVRNEETWAAQLERLDARLEVLNFGVGGYGLDQAYLRYRDEGPAFHPHVVLIGLMAENITRHVSVFRAFLNPETRMPMAKPRFVLDGDQLRLLENPLPTREHYARLLRDEAAVLRQLGRHDYFYRTGYRSGPFDLFATVRLAKLFAHSLAARVGRNRMFSNGFYHRQSEAFQITAKLCETFHRAVQSHGAVPVILLFPQREDILRYRTETTTRYAPLLDDLRTHHFESLDLVEAFAEPRWAVFDRELFMPEGHYSPLGNEVVAQTLLRYVTAQGLLQAGGTGAAAHPLGLGGGEEK